MAFVATSPRLQFLDNNGSPAVGYKLYTYASGTSTPMATYTDQTGLVANANPIILDSRGEADVWLGSTMYRFILKTSADAIIWSKDGVGQDSALLASQVNMVKCVNRTSGTFAAGACVYTTSIDSSYGIPMIVYANNTTEFLLDCTTVGMVIEPIAPGATGFIQTFGLLEGINTSGGPYGETWTRGDKVYLSTTVVGALTKNRQSTVYNAYVGTVGTVSTTSGSIFLEPRLTTHINGDQTISGVKTFGSSPLAPNATSAGQLATYGQVVKNTGNETINGLKTFAGAISAVTNLSYGFGLRVVGDPTNTKALIQGINNALTDEWGYIEFLSNSTVNISGVRPAPIPKISSGVGQWINLGAWLTGSTCYLPAGGTWAYWGANNGVGFCDIKAGGTLIWSGSANNFFGFAWRIA